MKYLIKSLFSSLILTAFCFVSYAQTSQTQADKIIGVYWSPEKDAKVEIYKKGHQYYGRSIWVAHPKKDTNNPNDALKTREVLGIDLFSNFSFEDGAYTSGKVYDPGNGKTYDCKMSLDGDILKVRGFVGISLFGRTELFKRIS
jgi:uncharacterized protein (DUF2147 family)